MSGDRNSSATSSPMLLRQLAPDQQEQLTEILDQYLTQLENDQPPDRSELLKQHPALAEALDAYLRKLDELHLANRQMHQDDGALDGKRLGEFRLEQEIGRGGMGIVFAAQDELLDRPVAVKLLPLAALLDEKHVERFKNEARAAATADHPNIVPVYCIGEEGGIHYFAMRRIDGASLDTRVCEHRQNGTLPPVAPVVKQFADVADALHAAHEFGVVHRDIKPSNLLLDRSHKMWVTDFGLARCQSAGALTRTGETVGTMRYMSPEQAAGQQGLVDHRTDIYSLGATLFEILSLRPVVEGEEGPHLLNKIGAQTPPRICKLRRDCSRDLETVLDKAMASNRDDRYATAAELSADLLAVSEGRPISARRLSPIVRVTRLASKHALAIAIAASILLVVAIGLVTSNLLILRESQLKEQYLVSARSSVDELADVVDELAAVPGAEQIRQNIIQRTLNYYTAFAEQAAADPNLQASTAAAYTRIGALQEELGSPAEALPHYYRAAQLYDQLVAKSPRNGQLRQQRLKNLNYLGVALADGKPSLATSILGDAVCEQRAMPESTRRAQLALTLNNYGDALQTAGRPEEAKLAFIEAIELLSGVNEEAPDDSETIRGLAAAHQNLAILLAKADPDGAIERLEQALSLQLQLVRHSANHLRTSRDLTGTYINLGNIHLEHRRPQEARDAYQKAVQIGEQLVAISPNVDSYRRDLAVAQSNLGMTQFRLRRLETAAETLQQSCSNYRMLLDKHASHLGLQCSLGIALNNRALVETELGKPQQAEDLFTQAAELLETARAKLEQFEHIATLEQIYSNHARMLYMAGREAKAAALVERQLTLAAPSVTTKTK